VTPLPLILLVWGVLLVSGVLPNRIFAWRVPATAEWRRIRLTIAVAAIVSGGFWLALDLVLPMIVPRPQMGTRLADIIGGASVIVAVGTCARLMLRRNQRRRALPVHTDS
jgi:hypothetical protein